MLRNNNVSDVKTGFPKRIYLSADVNASVFYDSSFWSMFLLVKKNLQIGLGLMNAVSKQELKVILWCKEEIDEKTRGRFERYLEQDWKYFAGTVYFDHELDLLFIAMNDFLRIIARIHYLKKNSLLATQLEYSYSSSSLV